MKRISLVTLVLLPLFYLGACKWLHGTPQYPAPIWAPLNCPSNECWRTSLYPKEPEVAILRMPDSEYKTFASNAKAYLDNNHILSAPANGVQATAEACQPPYTTCHPGDPWTVIVSHTPNSTVIYMAFERP
jgi:hypothetical protein